MYRLRFKSLQFFTILILSQLQFDVSFASQKLDLSRHISVYEVVAAKCSGYGEPFDPCKEIVFLELSKHGFFGARENSIFLVKWIRSGIGNELGYEAHLLSKNELIMDGTFADLELSSDDLGAEKELLSVDDSGVIDGYLYQFTPRSKKQGIHKRIEFVLKPAGDSRLKEFVMEYPNN